MNDVDSLMKCYYLLESSKRSHAENMRCKICGNPVGLDHVYTKGYFYCTQDWCITLRRLQAGG